jgi:hypothetical protein
VPRRGDWRFILQGIDGSGTPGPILHPDLPLSGVSITEGVNVTNELKATISPTEKLIKPMLVNWGSMIWAEAAGKIRGGGILVHKERAGTAIQLEVMGLHGYAYGMPYGPNRADSIFFVEADPLDIYRHIWTFLQGKPGGNLGLTIDPLKTGLKIGVELEQGEFDTQNGPISYESGPYKLNWYETHDLGKNIDDLASDTPFEFREVSNWNAAGTGIETRIELAYPRFSRKRTDLRFVVGDNVIVPPTVTDSGDDWASELMLLGAGEGRTMILGAASLPRGARLRRVAVEEDKTIKDAKVANTRAYNLLKARIEMGDLTSVTVLDHQMAPLGAVRPGDEIYLSLDYDWQEGEGYWVRVETINYSPDQGNNYVLSVIRSDKVA